MVNSECQMGAIIENKANFLAMSFVQCVAKYYDRTKVTRIIK